MLEEISQDNITRITASNQPMFSLEPSYEELLKKKQRILDEWKALTPDAQKQFGNFRTFGIENSIPNIKDPNLLPSKNTYLLHQEIEKRLLRDDPLSLLPIEPLDFDDATLELAESLENTAEIRELYKIRKASIGSSPNAGISAEEAAKIKNCFNQGRELFLSGKNGSLLVKPLNFFYALTAYTYGVIILNSPFRYRKDMLPGSHGMAYLPASIQAQFGGDSARGTFSDLVSAFPTHLVKTPQISFNIDCSNSLMKFYENRFDVSLGTLLSMIPEMADYYKLTTGNESRCFPLEVFSRSSNQVLTWEFWIGNGKIRPSSTSIEQSFEGFRVDERDGKTIVTVPAPNSSNLNATIYTDLRGKLWFIENPFFPVILPEISVHFLITSIFSNIMRYRPDEWGSVLLNEVSSNISLLTRHYFSSFQRKFMLLVLRSSSRFIPYTL